MSWIVIICPDGLYEMNVEGVVRLIRSYAYAKAVSDNSKPKTESHIVGPDLELVNTDWDAVRKQRDHSASQVMDDFMSMMSTGTSGKKGIEYLEQLADARDDYSESVRSLQKTAAKHTMANIESSVAAGERGVEIATFIRDASAEAELALATGGASVGEQVAALTLGSVLKGGYKWQDTHSVGQGLLEAYIELKWNFLTFGIRSKLTGKVDRVLIGLMFGAIKSGAKIGPRAYLSPEDIRSGKSKTGKEILVPAGADVSVAVTRDLVDMVLGRDSPFAIPATVLLKVGLKHLAAAVSKPTAPIRTSVNDKTQSVKNVSGPQLRATCRLVMHSMTKNNLTDCAGPNEDFVLSSALRPLYSR